MRRREGGREGEKEGGPTFMSRGWALCRFMR